MPFEFIVLFLIGLVLLVKGADFFVDAAAKLAKLFGVSDFVIGLTIVAVGTSLPEIASSVAASLNGVPDLAIGIVVGSNMANIALVLGLACIIAGVIKVERKALDKDVFIMLFSAILLFYFSVDGGISYSEGIIFLVLFLLYTLFLLGFMKRFEDVFDYDSFLRQFFGTARFDVFNLRTYMHILKAGIDPVTYQALLKLKVKPFEEEFGKKIDKGEKAESQALFGKKFFSSLSNQFLLLIIGGAAVVYGSEILVDGSIGIASYFGISESLIGLFMVAIGTSLPELGVTLSSLRKGFTEILLGNIIGSNISNVFLVIGLSALAAPLAFSFELMILPMCFMLFFSAFLVLFIQKGYNFTRLTGAMFLAMYAALVIILSGLLPFSF